MIERVGTGFRVLLNTHGETIFLNRGERLPLASVGDSSVALRGLEAGIEVEIGISGTTDRLVTTLHPEQEAYAELETLEGVISGIRVQLNGRL